MQKKSAFVALLLGVILLFQACKKESTGKETQAVNRIPALIKDKWVLRRVFMDGQQQPFHFLEGAIYGFYSDGTYTFQLPGKGSDKGHWVFEDVQQTRLKMETSTTISFWTIETLNDTVLAAGFKNFDEKTWRYELQHP